MHESIDEGAGAIAFQLGESGMLKEDGFSQAADIAEAWANERAARKVDAVPEQKSHTR